MSVGFAALRNPPLPSSPLLHRLDPLFFEGGAVLHLDTYHFLICSLFSPALVRLVFIFYNKFSEVLIGEIGFVPCRLLR